MSDARRASHPSPAARLLPISHHLQRLPRVRRPRQMFVPLKRGHERRDKGGVHGVDGGLGRVGFASDLDRVTNDRQNGGRERDGQPSQPGRPHDGGPQRAGQGGDAGRRGEVEDGRVAWRREDRGRWGRTPHHARPHAAQHPTHQNGRPARAGRPPGWRLSRNRSSFSKTRAPAPAWPHGRCRRCLRG